MSIPSSSRAVRLIDARAPGRPFVPASVHRDYPAILLDDIEARWSAAREHAAVAGASAGLAPLEHSH